MADAATTALAARPLLAALGALLLLRWPATRAAALGCGLALLLVALRRPTGRPERCWPTHC